MNTAYDVNRFINAITDNDGALYSVYSIDKSEDTKTVKWYDVESDPSVAPLWMNGQAKPVGWPGWLKDHDPYESLQTNQDGYAIASGPDADAIYGDGTVSGYSADLRQLATDPARGKIHSIMMEDVGHTDFFNAEEPLRQIVAPLIDSVNPTAFEATLPYVPPDLPNPAEKLWRAIWWNECPVTMLITDPLGRRIGTTPDGQEVNEIPGGYYSGHSGDDEPDVITFPNPASGVYTVTITGLEADAFHIKGDMLSPTMTARIGNISGNIQPGQVMTYTTSPFVPNAQPRLLLVDDHAGQEVVNLYLQSLSQLGRTPDVWDVVQQGLPDLNALYPYHTVVWATGAATLAPSASLTLEAYIYNGGTALLSGQDIDAGIADPALLAETLRAELVEPAANGRTLQGQGLLDGLTLHLNDGDGANNQTSPSAIVPLRHAVPLATYFDGNGAGQAAGLAFAARSGRLVYLSFGIEGLQTESERTTVLDRLLRWLESGETPQVPPAAPFPATAVLDAFQRPDGAALGNDWTGNTGGYQVLGAQAAGSGSLIYWDTPFDPEQEVFVTLSEVDADAQEIDLILKAQDTSECNLLELWYQPSRGTVQVVTCHNYGTWVQHGADIPVTFQPGDLFGARARADGVVEVYKNGVLLDSIPIGEGWPYRASGGRIGLWLIDANDTRLDDFGGGTLP
jgi:hypothetical protein